MNFPNAATIGLGLLIFWGAPAIAQTAQEEAPKPPEPPRIYQAACPALMDGRVKGRYLPPIKDGDCGENSPIEITQIMTVGLSAPATINCRMAGALHDWVGSVDEMSVDLMQSRLSTLTVSTSYHCRRRNNAPDGKISEHGFMNALDVIGFELVDGTRISVLDHWPPVNHEEEAGEENTNDEAVAEEEASTNEGTQPTLAEFLRLARDEACERFTTVLGPEANPLHADHFHFDLGCHGKKCTYKICE